MIRNTSFITLHQSNSNRRQYLPCKCRGALFPNDRDFDLPGYCISSLDALWDHKCEIIRNRSVTFSLSTITPTLCRFAMHKLWILLRRHGQFFEFVDPLWGNFRESLCVPGRARNRVACPDDGRMMLFISISSWCAPTALMINFMSLYFSPKFHAKIRRGEFWFFFSHFADIMQSPALWPFWPALDSVQARGPWRHRGLALSHRSAPEDSVHGMSRISSVRPCADRVRVKSMNVQIDNRPFADFDDLFVQLFLILVTTSSIRAGWMRPSATSFWGPVWRSPSNRVEAADDDGFRCIVDDDFCTRCRFERADVASFTTRSVLWCHHYRG